MATSVARRNSAGGGTDTAHTASSYRPRARLVCVLLDPQVAILDAYWTRCSAAALLLDLSLQLLGRRYLPQLAQVDREVARRGQGVGVVISEDPPPPGEGVLVQLPARPHLPLQLRRA